MENFVFDFHFEEFTLLPSQSTTHSLYSSYFLSKLYVSGFQIETIKSLNKIKLLMDFTA